MTDNAHEPKRCGEMVHLAGSRASGTCWRPAYKGGKCRIHCNEAVARRQAKSAARFDAKMKEARRVWSNEALGIVVRQIVQDMRAGKLQGGDAVAWNVLMKRMHEIDKEASS